MDPNLPNLMNDNLYIQEAQQILRRTHTKRSVTRHIVKTVKSQRQRAF